MAQLKKDFDDAKVAETGRYLDNLMVFCNKFMLRVVKVKMLS